MDLFGLKKSTDFPVAEGHEHPLADDRAQPGTPRVSHFEEPNPAQHDTVTKVGVQADRARPGKNGIQMNLLIQDPRS